MSESTAPRNGVRERLEIHDALHGQHREDFRRVFKSIGVMEKRQEGHEREHDAMIRGLREDVQELKDDLRSKASSEDVQKLASTLRWVAAASIAIATPVVGVLAGKL